jgi:hypothetical protein
MLKENEVASAIEDQAREQEQRQELENTTVDGTGSVIGKEPISWRGEKSQ